MVFKYQTIWKSDIFQPFQNRSSPDPHCAAITFFCRATVNRHRSQDNSPDSRRSYIDDLNELDGADEPEHEEVQVELPPYLPSVYGCRNMEEFEVHFLINNRDPNTEHPKTSFNNLFSGY